MGLVVTAGLPAIHGTRIRQNRGSVEYRISSKEKNSDAWKPMKQACQDKDGSTHFELPVTPSKGTWYIQFRVRSGGTTLELTDWNVSVPATAAGPSVEASESRLGGGRAAVAHRYRAVAKGRGCWTHGTGTRYLRRRRARFNPKELGCGT